MTALAENDVRAPQQGARFIDTDVHERANLEDLLPYLEPVWHKYITQYGWTPDRLLPYSQPTAGGLNRADAAPPGGGPAGSDLGLLREQLLDAYEVEFAVLTGWLNASSFGAGWPEFKTALMRAYNDWQIATFLNRDARLRGSIHVNAWDVEGAVAEIERVAPDPRFVQVMIYVRDQPFGDPRYHPIYAAAERHDLVVAFHHSENSPAAHGFYRYFAEWHTLVPQVLMSQTISLIFNGVFDHFPSLRVLMIESGFSYVPHLMWHADQQYRQLRHETPWVKRKPSDTIRDQIRFASQPIEDFTAEELETLIGQMQSEALVCFSSDYPHWDFDSPVTALPRGLDASLKAKILLQNAQWLYGRRA